MVEKDILRTTAKLCLLLELIIDSPLSRQQVCILKCFGAFQSRSFPKEVCKTFSMFACRLHSDF